MVALRDLDPEEYDALESLGEWRALNGLPEPSDDSYWFTVARYVVAPIPPDEGDIL